MGSYTTVMKQAYEAALQNDWYGMVRAYDGENGKYVMAPLTVSKDTPFHLAVYSKRSQPLRDLLDIVDKDPELGNPCTETNAYGNTVLHEAVVAGNKEAVELLFNKYNPLQQLQTKNMSGETPLYTAASSVLNQYASAAAKKTLTKFLGDFLI